MSNEDFWGFNKPEFQAQQQKLVADRAAVMENNPYSYNMQLQTLQTRMLAESEAGSSRTPPMLLNIEDFPSWRGRFETHVNGQDTSLWQFIETKYVRPMPDNSLIPIPLLEITP